jgi:hypothetical protein
MEEVKVTSLFPDIIKGIDNETLERIGGVIYDAATRHIIAFFRETVDFKQITSEAVSFLAGGAGLSILNFGVSTMGFAVVLRRVSNIADVCKRTERF